MTKKSEIDGFEKSSEIDGFEKSSPIEISKNY